MYPTSIKTRVLGLLAAFFAWLADAAYLLLRKANEADEAASEAVYDSETRDISAALDKTEREAATWANIETEAATKKAEADSHAQWLRDTLTYR